MKNAKPTRRQFVQLAGGLALALRHGLLPAQTETGAAAPPARPDRAAPTDRAPATLEDGVLRIEWDANLHARVSRKSAGQWLPITAWQASEYLLEADARRSEVRHFDAPHVEDQEGEARGDVWRNDARHIADFALQHKALVNIDDANGTGTQLTLSGTSADGVEKTVRVTLHERHPGIALVRVSYRNNAARILNIGGWTNGDFRMLAAGARTPQFWCYSGATYEDRRDWVQPVEAGFEQDNFLGMEASDYGGGTPIVDVWRRDGGLAVGHVESTPRRVSLPVQGQRGAVRVAVCGRDKRHLKAGDSFDTPETFVAVHGGDYFAALNRYRLLMSERGMTPAVPPAPAYDAIWCAWGYERSCTTELIKGTLSKVKDLGLEWAVIDDGWQAMIGDWNPHRAKYPNGDADVRALVADIRAGGLKPRLWYSPLSAAPGSDLLHDHADMLLLDKDGAVQKISWWNSFYLCPAYAPTVQHTQALIRKFFGEWGFAGLKIDGQHLNNVAPCFNPAHHHARPEESVEALQSFFAALYQTATAIDRDAVMELCPCGTAYSAFNFPSMNQAPASDPESSWQVRHKGKTLKALMGPSAAFAGDHVELSDGGEDFASTVGVGGIVSTKFTWPRDPKPKDSFLLTPERETLWRRWIALYNERRLPQGVYRGELYDIGFDKPETHVVEKSGRFYYAFFAADFAGSVPLRGLAPGRYRLRDYVNDKEYGEVPAADAKLEIGFHGSLLIEAIPV